MRTTTEVLRSLMEKISEVVSEVLLWNPQHGRRSRGRPMQIYLDQLRDDTMCTNEELSIVMNDRGMECNKLQSKLDLVR